MSVQLDRPAPGVARLRLDRPEARNAINDAVRNGLHDALVAVRDDASVRALLLGGTGGVFCAGGDLPSLVGLSEADALARMRSGHRNVALLWEFPKPVVAAVERFAIGAGAGLALLADEIVIGDDAILGLPFARLGLVADWGVAGSLAWRIGPAKALGLYAGAASLKGADAVAAGLAERAVPAGEVMDAALARAVELARVAPNAFARVKALLRGKAEPALQLAREAHDQAACVVSAEFAEGYAAFCEKRPPRF